MGSLAISLSYAMGEGEYLGVMVLDTIGVERVYQTLAALLVGIHSRTPTEVLIRKRMSRNKGDGE